MLAVDLLFGDPLKPGIRGMVVGHLYYFLTVLHPLAGGKFILKTPLWVYPFYFFYFFILAMHALNFYLKPLKPHSYDFLSLFW